MYLHEHEDFSDLIRIVGEKESINDILVEKDYWIMHCLFGLQDQGWKFQLKGGTSLSKGFKLINRFSEDIDIRIEPPADMEVFTGKNHSKQKHVDSRKRYYDWLCDQISISGITGIERDTVFDENQYRSGGIRISYPTKLQDKIFPDVKEGILLEVGFDDVAPNTPITISSWVYDHGSKHVQVKDNRAKNILCYHPGYTLVEKLQTISTKYRKHKKSGQFVSNFMRHYYDVYCLLEYPEIVKFISTDEYLVHKQKRFRNEDEPRVQNNEAFAFTSAELFEKYNQQYQESQSLYFRDKPTFKEILDRIRIYADKL